jgi:hypothetical protein
VFTIACASSALRAKQGRVQAFIGLALAAASVVAVFLPV